MYEVWSTGSLFTEQNSIYEKINKNVMAANRTYPKISVSFKNYNYIKHYDQLSPMGLKRGLE